jgi:hypothetical protein
VSDEFVAQFKFTVLITNNNTSKITGLDVDRASFKSDKSVTDEDLITLLDKKIRQKKKKNKKKKKTTTQ